MTDSPKSDDTPAEGRAARTPSLPPDGDGDGQPVNAFWAQRHAGWRERTSQLLPTRLRRQHLVVGVSLAITLSAVAFSVLPDAPVAPPPTGVTTPGAEPTPTTAALAPSPSLSPSESASPSRAPAGGAATDETAPSKVPTRTVSAPSSPAKPSTTKQCTTVQEVRLCSRVVGSGPFRLETSINSPRALGGTWVYSTGAAGDGGEPTDELVHAGGIQSGSASWTTDCGDFTTMWSNILLPDGEKAKTKSVKCP